jgi:hypothetical protein
MKRTITTLAGIALAIVLLILFAYAAHAASSGPLYPGTTATVPFSAGNAWANPGNIAADDGSYASANYSSGGGTEYLQGTNYGFSIPSDATINGITMEVERKYSGPNAGVDSVVRIIKGGVVSGNNKANTGTAWTTSDVVVTYGSASDLWGLALTPADVNASNFGLAFVADTFAGLSGTANIDYIRITVTYTPAAPVPPGTVFFE